MKWLVVAVCLIQAAQYAIANGVPVFVWGDTASNSAPVLSNQATHNLDTVLTDETSKVIFVDSQLNSDDFNYCSWKGHACFPFLGRQTSKFYSPSVESPVAYLRSRVWNGAVKTAHADEDFSVAAGETVFVHFRNGAAHPTQNDRLAAHDSQIARTVARLGEKGITYVYTAIEGHETHKRVARQATDVLEVRGTMHVIRMTELFYIVSTNNQETRTNISLPALTVNFNKVSDTTATLTLSSSPALQMDLVQEGSRWWVENLVFDGKNFTSGDRIGANDGFSYACLPQVTYQSPPAPNTATSTRLFITGLQLEINLARTETTQMPFSEAWNCVGFTSAGIWGGLFVTILLLAILTIGISWMLDINTMDRFDDPKGKTITINAQD